ncbi:MAG: hypothetical protein ACK5PB_14050 [Pirellula sp.]|jgi:hypothetical protein
MKKNMSLSEARADWQKAIRDQLPAAKGDPIRAASLASKLHPELRAAVVRAANPKKKVQDEDLEEDLDSDDTEIDDEELDEDLDDDEVEQPVTKRKAKSKRSKSEDPEEELKALQSLWQQNIRSEMKRSKCDAIRAACIVAKKYPNVRRKLVAAANVR